MPTDGPSPMSRARIQQSEEAESTTSEDKSLADKLRDARERVRRREKATRADKRAKSRRIREGDPETASEAATVKKRELEQSASEAKTEASGLADDAKKLISAEFGVSSSGASAIISQGSELLSSAGDQLDRLDVDGDGDTDILARIEQGVEAQEQQPRQRQSQGSIEPPVGDIEDDFDEVGAPGVEAELELDFPIEDDL